MIIYGPPGDGLQAAIRAVAEAWCCLPFLTSDPGAGRAAGAKIVCESAARQRAHRVAASRRMGSCAVHSMTRRRPRSAVMIFSDLP